MTGVKIGSLTIVKSAGFQARIGDRGVALEVLQDTRGIEMMRRFILEHPAIWNEDIGV